MSVLIMMSGLTPARGSQQSTQTLGQAVALVPNNGAVQLKPDVPSKLQNLTEIMTMASIENGTATSAGCRKQCTDVLKHYVAPIVLAFCTTLCWYVRQTFSKLWWMVQSMVDTSWYMQSILAHPSTLTTKSVPKYITTRGK